MSLKERKIDKINHCLRIIVLSKNAKSSEVPHRNKDEVLQTERNDKYLPSANHICLKEEKLNRSFTVVAHILFCHQAKDYLYCIVYTVDCILHLPVNARAQNMFSRDVKRLSFRCQTLKFSRPNLKFPR